jgi:hypothetical protein
MLNLKSPHHFWDKAPASKWWWLEVWVNFNQFGNLFPLKYFLIFNFLSMIKFDHNVCFKNPIFISLSFQKGLEGLDTFCEIEFVCVGFMCTMQDYNTGQYYNVLVGRPLHNPTRREMRMPYPLFKRGGGTRSTGPNDCYLKHLSPNHLWIN